MNPLTFETFRTLMEQLARAWSEQDTEAALDCFTLDALYTEPPDIQLYRGHDQLRPYFAALKPGTRMEFHQLWFDPQQQSGVGEYSFGMAGRPTADHGVVVVTLHEGRIAVWREYQRKGPASFAAFLATEGKTWQWHIGNYP
jgi:ketosteroid isomerase-like protein